MITASVMKGLRELMSRETFSLKNHAQNVLKKLPPDAFLKKSKFTIALINSLILNTCFIACEIVNYRNLLKLSSRPLPALPCKFFFKKTKRGLSLFLHKF